MFHQVVHKLRMCILLDVGPTETLYHAIVRQLPKIRCNRCKKYRSAVNGPAVIGVVQTQQTQHSCSL